MGAGETAGDDTAPFTALLRRQRMQRAGCGPHRPRPVAKNLGPRQCVHGAKRCTALHMAARRGNVDVIGALLDGGADIEARDSDGDTPLRRAVNRNKVEAAKLLLARGADPHSKGSKTLTPALAARSDRMRQVFK